MITLYAGGAGFGLPEVSPYCAKTEIQLKMAGLAYEKRRSNPTEGPKGQLPFIDDDGTVIGDSTFIRAHIEKRYGVDLDAGLDARQRSESWAIERMIENHLGWAMVHARWMIPENFEKGPAHFVDGAPEAMRPQLRRELQDRVAASLRSVGIGRHAEDEILVLSERSLGALSALLGDRAFLMGDRPTAVDAVAFGVLGGILTPFFDSPLRDRASRYENLVAYTARMMARFYPEHPAL